MCMFIVSVVSECAVMQGTGNLDSIQVIKKLGGGLQDSYLDEGKRYVNPLSVCLIL